MKWRDLLPVLLIAIAAGCLHVQKRKAVVNKPPMPPEPPKAMAVAPKPPRPFYLTLMISGNWTNTTGFKWYQGNNSIPNFTPTNAIFTVVPWVTISNLYDSINYEWVCSAVDAKGVESWWSTTCHLPQPLTNYMGFGVSAKLTNPWTTNAVLVMDERLHSFRVKRQPLGYELQDSPNFMAWTTVTSWPASNPLPDFYLRASHWDQLTGKKHYY